ncbi:MAG TPA: GatB/YqeY domain-containing protein [Gammaproteobacteria bacterium]|nr:GatB/YqeY domain-containing protein [Gammaproteobacteria bacterium]
MSLKLRIENDMKNALRAGDKPRLGVVRMALAAIKQREIDERKTLDEPESTAVIEKLIKQRRESVVQFEQAGRDELAAKERAEIEVLAAYLPEQLGDHEIDAVIDAAIAGTGAASMRDMGKVMAEVKRTAQGRADMSIVSARVKARLA